MINSPVVDTLDSERETSLFQWTFAIVVANASVQTYRLVAQFTTFIFDLFKLSHGVDLFWPLTTDDLRPYSHYLTSKNDILYKLAECLLLTIIGIYGARCLLSYSMIGLVVYFLIFFIHSSLTILGYLFVEEGGKFSPISFEFAIWSATVFIEVAATFLTALFIIHFGWLFGIV